MLFLNYDKTSFYEHYPLRRIFFCKRVFQWLSHLNIFIYDLRRNLLAHQVKPIVKLRCKAAVNALVGTVQSASIRHFPTLYSVDLLNCRFSVFVDALGNFNFFSSLLSRIGRLLLTHVRPERHGQEKGTASATHSCPSRR